MWAALTPAYTLTTAQSSTNSAYGSNYDVTISGITWNAPGNQNFDGYWRIGGKKAKAADETFSANRIITGKGAITGQIKKVTFFHNGKSANGIGVPSVTLTIASDAAFNTVVDEIVVNPTISTSTSSSFDFTPTNPLTEWEDCYYKFTINVTNTTTTNGGIDLTSIVFYEEGADVAITGITIPSTADVAVGRTRTLTATVTPDNYTETVDWESDNTSIATVTSEGVVTGVATGSTTVRAKSHADNTIKAECTVTVIEDVATLPFIWAGGSSSNLVALNGVAGNSLGDYADNESNRPYLVKFDAVNDYIQVRINGQPGIVSFGVKMLGGATTSKIKVQESAKGSSFTDVQELTISGSQNDIVNLETSESFAATTRYVRITKSVHASGGNIGVGPIAIAGTTVPITPAKTYTTLTNAFPLDFTSVSSDLKAYIATEIAAGKVQMTQVNKVPAGTGLVLEATSTGSPIDVPVLTAAADNVTSNKMAGSAYSATTIAANAGYILKDGVFQPASAGTLAAGKAYLNIAVAAGAPILTLDFGGNTPTGISATLNNNEEIINNNVFNLAGQRVMNPSKGLYIVNGKKVVIK